MDWHWLGLAFLLGLTTIPLALWILLWYFKRKLGSLFNQVATPLEVTLEPLKSPSWRSEQPRQHQSAFLRQGFRHLADYSIPQMPGVQLSVWLQPGDRTWGVIYDHPVAGCWLDILSLFPDDMGCTHTSAPESGLERYPKSLGRRLPGQAVDEVLAAHRSERPSQPLDLSALDFVTTFQQRYRQEMEWRASKGTSREEIERVASLQGKTYTSEVLDQTFQVERQRNRALLEEALYQNFLETTAMSASEWKKVEDDLLFVHDQLTLEDMVELGFQPQPTGTPRSWARSGSHRCLGSVSQPIEADVYLSPPDSPPD